MLRHALLALCTLALGCGGQTTGPTTEIQSMTLHATGGFIGEDMVFAIAPDGSITATGHGTQPAGTTHAPGGAGDASTLYANVLATNVLGVSSGSYVPPNPCCDRIEDDLTVVTTSGTEEWAIMADGEGAPAEVLSALQLVHAYLDAAQ